MSTVRPLIRQCAKTESICRQLRNVRVLATCVPHTDACCGAFGQDMICVLTGLDAGPR